MTDKQTLFENSFLKPVRTTGRNTILLAIVCMLLPGIYLMLFYGIYPPLAPVLRSSFAVLSYMVILQILEAIIYFPILGFAGTYMSFLVGNILNLRVPVSATAQQVIGTQEGTPEAEIVSTLGIAGSVIASELVMIVGVLAFLPFINRIQNSGMAIEVALNQVLPALFGALGGVFLFRVPKLGIIPLGLAFLIAFIKNDVPYSVVIPIMVIISIASARFMYKRNWIKGEGMM
jgi:hypothetical protein